MTLDCTTKGKTKKDLYLAEWDFDTDNTQNILDTSGNGFHLYKTPVNDIEAGEIFRVKGQGYLFENSNYVQAGYPILLHNYPTFTIDLWVRRNPENSYPSTDPYKESSVLGLCFWDNGWNV